jgi:GT2 family glycosyltransferase
LQRLGLDRRRFRLLFARHDRSATLNALVGEAHGEFVLPVPDRALLRPNALLELAMVLAVHPKAELVYSDEDCIRADGRREEPKFKPAWSPDFFAAYDYIGNLTLLRRATLRSVGGWRPMPCAAMHHDLKLRLVDKIDQQNIVHIAKILAHCRAANHRTAEDSRSALEQMLADHIERRRLDADVLWREEAALPRLRYRVAKPPPLVSLIVPTRDRAGLLETCVRSILDLTRYQPFEILIVDNGSVEEATHRLFSVFAREPAIRVMPAPGPFNYSALNNLAARAARGSVLGLVNNDVEITEAGWLEEMVALVVRPEVGCVGAKLLYPDRHIQHAGVYLGLGGLATHGFHLVEKDAPGQLNRLRTLQNVSAVTAACLLIRKRVFEEVGGLDEKELPVTLNDVDLCLKVRSAGYRNLWTPFAELVHHASVSRGRDYSPAKAKRMTHERSVVYARWGAHLSCDPYYSPNLTGDREDFSVRTN